MPWLNTIALLSNGLTLALAVSFVLIILWHNARKQLNQTLSLFLLLVMVWIVGSFGLLVTNFINPLSSVRPIAFSFVELGLTGTSVGLYLLTSILVGVQTRRFSVLAYSSLAIVVLYQALLVITQSSVPVDRVGRAVASDYHLRPVSVAFYLTFDGMTLYLIWQYRRKLESRGLVAGLLLFVVSHTLGLLNPALQISSVSSILAGLSTLLICFAVLRREIIQPLNQRINQVEAVHRVSLAISSHIALDTVLDQIARQATGWLNANAAGIYLKSGNCLELVTVHNLPTSFIHWKLDWGQGAAGKVAETQQSLFLENYGRDWKYLPDLPMAHQTFGSVISVPLIYGSETIGTLMVIAGRQGRLFEREDVQRLELLSAQAAVAIAHSRLFKEQLALTEQVEASRSQLEAVLTGTENPVVAVDRRLRVMFANPAARRLFDEVRATTAEPAAEVIPAPLLPTNYLNALRELRQKRVYMYEVTLNGKTYTCHVGQLDGPRVGGWVAVLNDITQLKELDRLKSEMIRMTSHDLKNPLQAALANLDLLSEDLRDESDPEIQESLQTVQKQLVRMNRIINGILDLERIRNGPISLDQCIPTSFIQRLIEDMLPAARERGIHLLGQIDSSLNEFRADPDQLERALSNLVENAIKFTPEGGTVQVKVSKCDGYIQFEVTDTGIGIPQELQPYVFDRFWRGAQKGQSGAEHISGTGLGLSLVKTVVENHKGTISLDSQPGAGTSFYIRLPQQT
jgi:signal transduction histidine kinase